MKSFVRITFSALLLAVQSTALAMDTDQDGCPDDAEIAAGTNPNLAWSTAPDGSRAPEFPVPPVTLTIHYGGRDRVLGSLPLHVEAYRVGTTRGPMAKWTFDFNGSERTTTFPLAGLSGDPSRWVVPLGERRESRSVEMTLYDERGNVVTNLVESGDGLFGTVNWGDGMAVGTVDRVAGTISVDRSRLARLSGGLCGTNGWAKISSRAVKTANFNRYEEKVFVSLPLPDSGQLRWGDVVFAAWTGTGDEDTWEPGSPYGSVSTSVSNAPCMAEIELTHTHPSICRMRLDRLVSADEFSLTKPMTDRSARGNLGGYLPNVEEKYVSTNRPSATDTTRVRIVRTMINGIASRAYTSIVWDGRIDLMSHPCLTEADLMKYGRIVIDNNLTTEYLASGERTPAGLTSSTYRIVVGDGDPGDVENFGENLAVQFVNVFESGIRPTETVVQLPLPSVSSSGRPVFRWSHTTQFDKAYPAFRLKVYSQGGAVAYDSGILPSPPRDADGVYRWQAPLTCSEIGAVTGSTWSVAMVDDKFTSGDTSASPRNAFTSVQPAPEPTTRWDDGHSKLISSHIRSPLFDSPFLRISLVYNGEDDLSGRELHVEARKVGSKSCLPDAEWTIRTSSPQAFNRLFRPAEAHGVKYLPMGCSVVPSFASIVFYRSGSSFSWNHISNETHRASEELVSVPFGEFADIDFASSTATLSFDRLRALTKGYFHDSYVRIQWSVDNKGWNGRRIVSLGLPDWGVVPDGDVVVSAWVGSDKWYPGEPYGAAMATVSNGMAEASIELTHTHPSICRMRLDWLVDVDRFSNTKHMTDRSVRGLLGGYKPNVEEKYVATNRPSATDTTRVRIVRNWINCVADHHYTTVLWDGRIDLASHPCLTEADLMASGVLGLDWYSLTNAYLTSGESSIADIEESTYRIVVGDGETGRFENFGDNLAVQFVNVFESGIRPTETVVQLPLPSAASSGRPVFRWSHTNYVDKAYPAFRLKVYDSSDAVLYDSGVRISPARDADQVYTWRAPFKCSDYGITTGCKWSVSMIDDKFCSPDYEAGSVRFEFREE